MECLLATQPRLGVTAQQAERGPRELRVDLEQIPLGQGRAFVAGGIEVAVFRQRDGQVFALHARCPHRGGPLADGLLGAGKVICPLHGWVIDLASGECRYSHDKLPTYPVRVEGGTLIVTLEPQLGEAP